MFDQIQAQPPDPILSLATQARADTRPDLFDLTIGVYFDEGGNTPVMAAVKTAERMRVDQETSKTYIGAAGDLEFCALMQSAILAGCVPDARVATVQAPGGSGAITMVAEMVRATRPDARVWSGREGYVNHATTFRGAGLDFRFMPHLAADQSLDFDALVACLDAEAKAGDLVILHGCCHNPTGVNFTLAQWQVLTDLCLRLGLLPFIDLAYQGLGQGWDEDAAGLRSLCAALPEALVGFSCSKNFGLYRDRTGGLILIGDTPSQVQVAKGAAEQVARRLYSMPPHHGAEIVKTILKSPDLARDWRAELDAYRQRMVQIRRDFSAALARQTNSHAFDFIARQEGMFSLLPLKRAQVEALRVDQGVYLVPVSDSLARINIAACRLPQVDALAAKLAASLRT